MCIVYKRFVHFYYLIYFDIIKPMKESWTRRVADVSPYRHVYPPFLRDISPMEIVPEEVRGIVLVIGQSSAFPERTLIATPESGFEKLRPGVRAIYCCDPTYPSSPEVYFDFPCVNTVCFGEIPDPEVGTIYWEPSSSYTFLEKVKLDFFDTILMFRVVDTGTQIKKLGLIRRIAPHLGKGGLFIASGGRFPEVIPEGFYNPLELVRSARLTDYSDGYPFTRHTGIVLRR